MIGQFISLLVETSPGPDRVYFMLVQASPLTSGLIAIVAIVAALAEVPWQPS